ncbi:MAG: hypothetical protein KatS3mg076_3009 [Candidatus Binatia bacterium]|nr:MAG: hypothetical protein KatS3mg076_3009 [Candidatus Binatia bacterium]
MPPRWITALGAILLCGLLAVATVWYFRRPARPERAELATALEVSERPFGRWVRFERLGDRTELFARYYVDLLLGHRVFKFPPRDLPSSVSQFLFLDDDDVLLASGEKLWGKEVLPWPGMVGEFCYVHSNFCQRRLFEVFFVVDGEPAVVYQNSFVIERFPSRTVVRYRFGGLDIDEHKYVTDDDRAVSTFYVQSIDGRRHELRLVLQAEHLPVPFAKKAAYPLLALGEYRGRPLYVYLDAPGFTRSSPGYPYVLERTLEVEFGTPRRAQVAVAFERAPREEAPSLPEDLLERHVARSMGWFAENAPYFDCPDFAVKKLWNYRWWLVRFHRMRPETPEFEGFVFYEGRLGFDNLVSFAVPVQLKELAYLRDPVYAFDQVRNAYRNRAESGALRDAPGSPYWGEMFSHWTTAAVRDLHKVHPLPADLVREVLPAMAEDVRAWLGAFDPDHDFLPSRDAPRVTGYDLDIFSWWHYNDFRVELDRRPPPLERVDFASFVFANARAVAEFASEVDERELAEEFAGIAEKVRSAVLHELWDPSSEFFYPRRAEDHERVPVREIHGFFPFAMGLVPDDPAYYGALRKLVDPEEFWGPYPPVITSLYHYRRQRWGMEGLTRNVAPHPTSMGGYTIVRLLHDYRQDVVKPEHFMELLRRYTELHYPRVHPGDPTWRPNAHEYYSEWEPGARRRVPKPSEISHDFHSMYNALVVEGAVGLRPRADDVVELCPAALGWEYFLLDGLRYHGRDLTIVWDEPDGHPRYEGFPEGFSLYVDGERVSSRPELGPLRFDLSRGLGGPEEACGVN